MSNTSFAYGQNKIFKIVGIVNDENNNPIIGAHIVSDNDAMTVTTEKGEFILIFKEQKPVKIEVSAIGFKTKTLEANHQSELPIKIILESHSQDISEINVQGTKTEHQHNQKIDVSHINLLPSASGPGIEGLVHSQMGVSSNNELSSQYRVRGGNFDENLVYVNGQEVYRPFLIHSGQQEGLSFVNPDLVESVEFSSGGYSSSYGDKMSSVLDIRYKRPEKSGGSFSGGMLGGSAHLEGVALKNKFTWVTGARYKTNRYLLGTLDEKGTYNPNFTDIQGFFTYTLSDKISFDFLGNYSLNRYNFIPESRETSFGTLYEVKKLKIYFAGQEKDRFETGYGAFTTHYNIDNENKLNLTFTGFRTFEEETYDIIGEYWMQEVIDQNDPDADWNPDADIGIGKFHQHARNELLGEVISANLRGEHLHKNSATSWSLEYKREVFKDRISEWEALDSAFYNIPRNDNSLDFSYAKRGKNETETHRVNGFVKNETDIFVGEGKLVVDAGIRFSYNTFTNETFISPRLLLSYLPTNSKMRYRASGGAYHQPPLYKEMRMANGEINYDVKSQKSWQAVAGFDYYFDALERPFKFTSELYYKWMNDLIPYQVDNVRIVYSGKNEAKGYAAGIDFKINGEMVSGEESWATLSFMKTEENLFNDKWKDPTKAGEPGYIPRPSDQRINFSLFLQDYLPKNPNFKAHLSFLFGTGLPFGPPRSERYMAIHRFPPYRRVDMGMSYNLINPNLFQKSQFKNIWIGVEVFNLLDINNTISHYWVTDLYNQQYAVPNYLTSRRVNLRLTAKF